jgi:predicted DNA-binding WGR domain protein
MASKQTGQKPDPQPFSFGLKLNFSGKANRMKDKVRLEHTQEGHNKFYEISFIPKGNSSQSNFTIHILYGKMGTQGSVKTHGFQEEQKARDFLNKKRGEKIRKGYKEVITKSH